MVQIKTAQDTVLVTTTTVTCDGSKDSGGHPRVYLKLDPTSHKITCPYCSRKFKLDPNAKVAAAH